MTNPETSSDLVKAIEWGTTSYGKPEAFTVAGTYRVYESVSGGWSASRGGLHGQVLEVGDGRTNFATLDEAKAAAQADYTARILSAIDATTIERLTAERDKALVTCRSLRGSLESEIASGDEARREHMAAESLNARQGEVLKRAAPIVAFHAGVVDKSVSSLAALNIHNELAALATENSNG
jgi:hypothetical protein